MTVAEGIRKLHSARCSARRGGKCGCRGGYEAAVFSPRDRRKIRKTFSTIASAKAWRPTRLRASIEARCAPGATVRDSADAVGGSARHPHAAASTSRPPVVRKRGLPSSGSAA